MGFYFNTYRQLDGDKAYNEKRYEDALVHYSEALKTLQLHAATQMTRHADFYDALVYVLSEIISTKLLIIEREALNSNFATVINYWRDIPGLLHEMMLTHKTHLEKSRNAFSNKENVITRVSKLFATVCEEVSDELVDQFEEDEEGNLELLAQSIEWMKRAIDFQIKTEGTPKLSSSLGYLNLLERTYKTTQDGTHLRVMSEYLSTHKLLEKNIKSPLRKLELLSYVARVALFNEQDIHELTAECKALYDLVPEDERDNPILEDLQNLLKLAPQEDEKEEQGEIENDAPEIMEDILSSDLLEDIPEALQSIPLHELDTRACPVDMLWDLHRFDGENSEVSTLPSSSTNNMSPIQLMSQSPLVSPSFSSNGFDQMPKQAFFSPSSQVPSEDDLPHCRAFQLALERITTHSANPRFLANLLCLIADFFDTNKARYIQKQNAIVLSHDLYRLISKIDPKHHRASEKLKNIDNQHTKLIGSYRLFSNGPQSPIPTITVSISEAKDYFNKALEELTVQLESLLMNQPAKVRITIDELACFISDQLSKGAITVSPSPEIGETLKNTFEEELKNLARSKSVVNF
ncbi:hypothetical protein [Legionella sp. WA2022007384]